mmetsp:Transcript_13382/g.28258  ORF Transcript_13382/g.28258 Transcript_13382/m.28258 type:complete len:266 (-) Transcript_13382:2-799(-)
MPSPPRVGLGQSACLVEVAHRHRHDDNEDGDQRHRASATTRPLKLEHKLVTVVHIALARVVRELALVPLVRGRLLGVGGRPLVQQIEQLPLPRVDLFLLATRSHLVDLEPLQHAARAHVLQQLVRQARTVLVGLVHRRAEAEHRVLHALQRLAHHLLALGFARLVELRQEELVALRRVAIAEARDTDHDRVVRILDACEVGRRLVARLDRDRAELLARARTPGLLNGLHLTLSGARLRTVDNENVHVWLKARRWRAWQAAGGRRR